MHANVGGNTATLVDVAFPWGIIPVATRGDIGQVDVVNLVFRAFIHFLFQRHNLVVQAELQNVIGLMSCAFLHFLQSVDVPRIQHHRLFANNIGTEAQAVTDVRIMQIIGRAHRNKINGSSFVSQTGIVAVEKFLLGEKGWLREITVDDAYAIAFVVGRHEVITCVLDGFKMAWGYVAAHTDNGEIFHLFDIRKQILHKSIINLYVSLFYRIGLP